MSEVETPTKPTKTEEPPKTQIQSRYETIRVPFFKQKTAYEMCDSDWSSDVCSSDLLR